MPRKSRNNGKVATANQLPMRAIQSGADIRVQLNAKGKEKNNIVRPFGVFGNSVLTFERAINLLSSLPDEDGVVSIYDKIIELEEREKIPRESLVCFVRNMNEMGGRTRWNRAPPETGKDDGSFHCWLEDKDGMIIDPHFKEYDDIMKMPRCNSREKVYIEWTPEQQKEKLKNLIPDILENINKNAKQNGVPKEVIMTIMAGNPGWRACCVNAWCIKYLRPELRLVIGNMGFRHRDNPNRVWWEY